MACSYTKIDPATGARVTVYPPTCMKCRYYDPATSQYRYRDVTMRLFYPNCPKINMMCNPLAGAYVAATTVCSQHLWS